MWGTSDLRPWLDVGIQGSLAWKRASAHQGLSWWEGGPAGWSDTPKCTISDCPEKLTPHSPPTKELENLRSQKKKKKLAPWAEWLWFLHTSTPRLYPWGSKAVMGLRQVSENFDGGGSVDLKTHQLEPPPLRGNWGCLLLPPFTGRGVQVEDAKGSCSLLHTMQISWVVNHVKMSQLASP